LAEVILLQHLSKLSQRLSDGFKGRDLSGRGGKKEFYLSGQRISSVN
jgi:hypothetical protein